MPATEFKSAEFVEESGSGEEEESESDESVDEHVNGISGASPIEPNRASRTTARSTDDSVKEEANNDDIASNSDSDHVDNSASAGISRAATKRQKTNGTSSSVSEFSLDDDRVKGNFVPPLGFVPVSVKISKESVMHTAFDPANLEGKKIWHITAPATVPISKLSELIVDDATSFGTTFEHGGSQYGITSVDGNGQSTKVLVPRTDCPYYKPVNKKVSSSFTVQHLGRVNHAAGSASAAPMTILEPKHRPSRTQPTGLRTRYLPPGFDNAGAMEVQDTEMAEPRATTPEPVRETKREPYSAPRKRLKEGRQTADAEAKFNEKLSKATARHMKMDESEDDKAGTSSDDDEDDEDNSSSSSSSSSDADESDKASSDTS